MYLVSTSSTIAQPCSFRCSAAATTGFLRRGSSGQIKEVVISDDGASIDGSLHDTTHLTNDQDLTKS